MKKVLALFLVLTCMLSLAACDKTTGSGEPVTGGAVSDMPEVGKNVSGETEQTQQAIVESISGTITRIGEENIDDATESAKEEDWEDKTLLEEYATYGIEEEDNFYYYQGELVYIIKDQRPDSSVYLLNTDSKGTVSIKVIRNTEGEITSVTYMTEDEVAKALPKILGGANEERDTNTDVLSPLDGVTMEVTDYSNTNVTVRITNDTDKDIQCGEDFCLEMQDEETGEWRELDTVNDGAFDLVAYMIQKESPYEKVINFEWLYGKLKPGRYRIVKTITDFRGTSDYTDYAYTAEFCI